MAPLLAADGHDKCPTYLGVVHLRLAEVEGPQLEGALLPSGLASEVRWRSPPTVAPPRKKAKKVDCLAAKVDTLTSEFAELKDLLLKLQPGMGASTRADSPQARVPVYEGFL